jgi:hypothetical protein
MATALHGKYQNDILAFLDGNNTKFLNTEIYHIHMTITNAEKRKP